MNEIELILGKKVCVMPKVFDNHWFNILFTMTFQVDQVM